MIGLLQRVTEASVTVGSDRVAAIERGLLVLVGVERGDTQAGAERLAQRLVGYRVFADEQGRMNASVTSIGGAVLLVPQFTLAADTRKGRRPSFASAADPGEGERLFSHVVAQVGQAPSVTVAQGTFGADMRVALVNDGPVTFTLRVPPT